MMLLISNPAESLAFSRLFTDNHQRAPPIIDVPTVNQEDNKSVTMLSRRDSWNRLTVGLITATIISTVGTGKPLQGRAACLYGDTSPDCIGVYKVHIDDEFLPFMDTPEKLKSFAPDVRWVQPTPYPKSYQEAVTMIKDMRAQCEGLNDIVLKGELEEAGVSLLDIIPKVTVSGRVILETLQRLSQNAEQPAATATASTSTLVTTTSKARERLRRPLDNASMKSYRAESAHVELLATLGQCDVLIGQARAGQLGALTLAQIHILADIREALEHFDEMLRAIPETV